MILASKHFHLHGNAFCEPLKNFPFPLTLFFDMTEYHVPCFLELVRTQSASSLKKP